MSLGSLIVQRGIASIREIEEALARQVLYGGDFVTNLLEVSRIEESALMPVVAEHHGLETGPTGELPKAPPDAFRLIASEVVAERAFAPLEVGKTLVIAVAEPLADDVEQELTFALALPIEQRIAPLFRIKQALARDYNLPLDKRTARLITKVLEKRPGMKSTFPPPRETAPHFRAPPKPPTVAPPPMRAPEPPPKPAAAPRGTFVREQEAAPLRPIRRRRGPLTSDVAKAELEASAERDVIFDVLFEFARQFFDYTALFIVHGDIAEGRDAFGEGSSREKVARIGVPLDLDNLLASARTLKEPVRRKPESEGLDPVLMSDLGRDGTTECMVFPVVVRTRVVALIFGDGGPSGIDDDGVGQVKDLVDASAGAFERVIVRRKLKGASHPPEHGVESARMKAAPSAPPPPTQASPRSSSREEDDRGARPAIEELAAPIQELLSEPMSAAATTTRDEPSASEPEPGPEPEPPSSRPTSDNPPPLQLLKVTRPSGRPIPREEPDLSAASMPPVPPPPSNIAGGPRVIPTPPGSAAAALASSASPSSSGGSLAPSDGGPKRTKSQSLRRAQAPDLQFGTPKAPSAASVVPETTRDADVPAARSWTTTLTSGLPMLPAQPEPSPSVSDVVEVLPPPISIGGDPEATPIAPSVVDPDSQPTPLAPPVEMDGVGPTSNAEPVLPLSQRKRDPASSRKMRKPMPASEQQISVAPHAPPSSRGAVERELPSIIVDVSSEYDEVVARALQSGDEEAEGELLRAGARAMPALMAKFPGPITIDRERLDAATLPRVAECGPVIRLVASQRRTALVDVLERVESPDVEVRFWSTYLLTELIYPDAVTPAVTRAFDAEPRVRRVARAAVRALAEVYPQPVVDRLAEIATSVGDTRRLSAIETLGESREPSAVAVLVPLLEDGGDAAQAAHDALVCITQQDFGLDVARWQLWWDEKKARHRIEWLIDSLMHEHRVLRASANEELRAITKEHFGYYEDSPRRERERAQAKYREWWESVGRVRFSRSALRGG